MKTIFNCAGWINFRKLINTLYFRKSLSPTDVLLLIFALYHMHFRHYSLRIKISFKIPSQCSLKLILITKFHGTFWTTFEQHPWFYGIPRNLSNKTSSSMEFHGIPWNFVQIQSSMELHRTFSILPSSMEFQLLIFPKKVPWNSFEVPWNSMELDKFHI